MAKQDSKSERLFEERDNSNCPIGLAMTSSDITRFKFTEVPR